ncbi:MAG: hypothetical protein K1Y36_26645 [Blastocatellia bacterium]|nr:hypothetical protein [Blastocatellia bacterium]
MAKPKEEEAPIEVKEYADGWITEKKGTDVPPFLKITFIVISSGCLAYLFIYMHGETTNAERGKLVQALNEVSGYQSANPLMYLVIALFLIYFAILVVFAFRKPHED